MINNFAGDISWFSGITGRGREKAGSILQNRSWWRLYANGEKGTRGNPFVFTEMRRCHFLTNGFCALDNVAGKWEKGNGLLRSLFWEL